MHPRLTHRGAWATHPGQLPIVEGTLIRLVVEHLPGHRAPKPVWLWTSATDADADAVTRCWQAYLRRFDLEHTIRFATQAMGWTRPRLHSPAAADGWTWLVLVAHTELRLARPLVVDLRRPWERPLPAERLTPRGSAADFATCARRARRRRRTETRPPRTRTTPRRHRPAPRSPLRRRQGRQQSHNHQRGPGHGLNDKLSGLEPQTWDKKCSPTGGSDTRILLQTDRMQP